MKSIISFTLAGLLLFTSCSESKTEKTAAEQPAASSATPTDLVTLTAQQAQNAGITLGAASQQKMGASLQFSGEVDVPPASLVSVSVPYGGFVKSINLLPGEHIRKGQVLAILEHQDYVQLQQEYLDTRAKLQLNELELKRQQELTEEKVGALKNLQQVRAERQILQNNLAALREKLLMININPARLQNGKITRTISIVSPINGFVKSTFANVGKMVNASDVLFELVNTDDLHLKLNVFENDAPYLRQGQKVTYTRPNDDEVMTAEIILIGHSVEGDKTIPVHAHMDHHDVHKLLPGMFVTASVNTGERNVTALPESAVVQFSGASYVFVDTGNRNYKRIPVETGLQNNGFVEVQLPASVQGSQKLVLEGAHNLLAVQENAGEEE